jgi:hypothetical protein
MVDVRQHLQKFLYSKGAFLPPLDKSFEYCGMDIDHRSEMGFAEGLEMGRKSDKAQSQDASAIALRYGCIFRQTLNLLDAAIEIIERRFAAPGKNPEILDSQATLHLMGDASGTCSIYDAHYLIDTSRSTSSE